MSLKVNPTRYHVVPTSLDIENDRLEVPADFETAVAATGYGAFNVLLLMAVIPAGWTAVFDTSTIAFVIPSADCDLDLDTFRKGTLVAAIYAGMTCAAIAWSLIGDNFGRKYFLLTGLILDAILNAAGSVTQDYYVYLLLKFISGMIVGGPYATLATYVAEFHGERNRAKILTWASTLFALGNIAVPALSRAILPLSWSFTVFESSLLFNSWRLFSIICGIPSVIGILSIAVLPESPKFLMTKGNSKAALKVLRRMYAMNTGKSADNYPIRALVPHRKESRKAASNDSGKTSEQTKPALQLPYVLPLFMVNSILFASMTGLHVMRAWLPQLIVILNNINLNDSDDSLGLPITCDKLNVTMIDSFRFEAAQNHANENVTCIPMYVSPTVYTNATIIAASAVVSSIIAGLVIEKIGKKSILLLSLLCCALCNVAINWSPSTRIFLILAAAIVALAGISTNTMTSMIADVIPPNWKATAMNLITITGRIGAFSGNLLFPILLDVSCDAPFYYIGGFLTLSFILTIFLSKQSQQTEKIQRTR